MGSRKTHEGAENVYAAAQKWVDRALRADDSLFTPGAKIWSSEWLGELRERFLDQPDVGQGSFYDKLKQQLEDSPPEVYQLMAEVLYFHFLIIWPGTMRGDTKENRIGRVLGWSGQQISIPADLATALTSGIANIGQARSSSFPFHVGFVIEFVEQWKEQELEERERLLSAPWEFKSYATRLNLQGQLFRERPNAHRVQREALLHLVFPGDFEGTVSVEQKEDIAGARAFAHFVTEETSDVDRKLAQIRQGLEAGRGDKDFDFYDPDIRVRWDPKANPWDEFIRRAKAIVDQEEPMEVDIPPKVETGRWLAAARKAVLEEDPGWAAKVKSSSSSKGYPIIHPIPQAKFRDWITDSPDDALSALRTIWARDDSSHVDRLRAFSELFPKSVISGVGTRATVASVLLMGLDVEQYPPFRTEAFELAYERTGYDMRPAHHNEAGVYEHALGFLDRLIEEASERGLTLPDRLHAQSVVWLTKFPEMWELADNGGSHPLPPPPPPLDLDSLARDLLLPVDFLEEIEALLEDKKQVIFQGPPGTGKTYVAQALAKHLAGSEERVTLVQLHPSYAYEDFVQGFRPTLRDGQPGFELRDGPLLRAARQARCEPDEKHFLVIDEINRGAPAKVLGELYFLLEYRDERVRLQYQRDDEEDFSLPPNLYFIGTMNTADRSIALVDLALRRRFYFVEFHPDDDPVKGVLRKWLQANAPKMKWVADVVERANVLLETDRHAAIGPSYFMKDGLDETDVERIWKHSVLSYIEERLFGEGDRVGEFDLERLRREAGHGAVEGQGERQEGAGTDEGGGSQ